MYTRGEMALRIGLFYTSASLSGAFGGLLARGLSSIGTAGGLTGWRWIFIIEGLIVSLNPNLPTSLPLITHYLVLQTAIVGVIAYFGLPNTISASKFLTVEERKYAQERIFRDRPILAIGADA
jgi:MFS family permease